MTVSEKGVMQVTDADLNRAVDEMAGVAWRTVHRADLYYGLQDPWEDQEEDLKKVWRHAMSRAVRVLMDRLDGAVLAHH